MGATATIVATGSRLDLVLLGVLLAVAAFLVAAYRTGVPYPILLVCGGAVIGLLPGVPATGLNPDLVLLIFVPPLLYAAAFFSSLRDLRANRSGPWLRHCPPPDRDDRHPRIPPAHATRPRHNSSRRDWVTTRGLAERAARPCARQSPPWLMSSPSAGRCPEDWPRPRGRRAIGSSCSCWA
jgi:hypothetical protein